jgi:predicted HicB family RNase H-like nuclease
MRRVMVRLEDDLYRALNDAAHDNRTSMNAFIVDTIRDKVEE